MLCYAIQGYCEVWSAPSLLQDIQRHLEGVQRKAETSHCKLNYVNIETRQIHVDDKLFANNTDVEHVL